MGLLPVDNLLELPDEILVSIFGLLDIQDLLETTLVCQSFHDLSDPFLYDTIQVLNGCQATALARSLNANPNRARWVRDLLVSTRFGEDEGLSLLPPFIAQMRNLQELRLETPDCNMKSPEDRISWVNLQDRYERIFGASSVLVPRDARPLPNLQSCTMHFVDLEKEIYSMTRYSMLFLHPTLKTLTISCASTDYPERLLVQCQKDLSLLRSTQLEHLHLEECDIFSPSLAILLSFPRRLRSLKVSEGVRYETFNARSSRLHGDVSPSPFIDALEQHCTESLESLSLSLGYQRHSGQSISHYGQHLNLTAFEALKYLEVDWRTANLLRSRPCDHTTWRRLPPNLETFHVFGNPLITGARPFTPQAKRIPLEACIVRSKAGHGVSKLQNVIFTYEYYARETQVTHRRIVNGVAYDSSPVEEARAYLIHECDRLKSTYKKADVHLRLDLKILSDGFIPPYLFPEEKPWTLTLWQSTAPGT